MALTPEELDARERSFTDLNDEHAHTMPRRVDRSQSQPVIRPGTWRGRVASVTANFFGIGDNCEEDQQRWRTRKSRHLSRRHGGLKPEYESGMTEREEISMGYLPMPHIIDPLARPGTRSLPREETDGGVTGPGRPPLVSQLSSGTVSSSIYKQQLSHRMIRQRSKRQSVARMGWDAMRSLKRPVTKPSLSHGSLVQQRPPLIHSRSFAPASLQVDEDEADAVSLDPSQFFSSRGEGDGPPSMFSPSLMSDDLSNEVFFDFSPKPIRRVPPLPRFDSEPESSEPEEDQRGTVREAASLPTVLESEKEESVETEADRDESDKDEGDLLVSDLDTYRRGEDTPDTLKPPKLPPSRATAGDALDGRTTEALANMIPLGIGWRKKTVDDRFRMPPVKAQGDVTDGDSALIRRNKIQEQIMSAAFDNSDRREIGKGLVGRVLNRAYRSKRMESYVKKQIEEIEDHRPYFTYWVTTVQVIILIVSIVFYGFAPIGFSYTQKTGLVQQSNLVVETVGFMEPDNFWIGPRPADLIHLGAKFSPCMHRDEQVYDEILVAKAKENSTGCCIRTDQSGCVQSHEEECSARFATFNRWSKTNPDGRTSGPVCGQDPRACTNPASIAPYEWPDDMTKWPMCVDSFEAPALEHTTCEVTGRPCCISITGKCEIVSRDYCEFVNGYFHEEATLCSQVDCLNEVCGLISFLNKDKPDQIYRIWISLFLHAGIFHCILSVIMQLTILRDLEKLAGWHRISVIYIFSGIGGNLTSAIFIPYRAEVGPAGSQFGLLACLAVEVLQSWQMLKNPCKALLKLLAIVCLLFTLGLLPWIDNYAHLGGFVCGTFLSFIFLPFICFGQFDKRRKRIQVVISVILVIGYFATCFLLFYLKQFRDCDWCKYLNCVPLTEDFCNDMDLRLTEAGKHTS